MARGHAVQAAELGDLLDRQLEAAEVQPGVKEHAAVARRQDEAVAVGPARALRVDRKGVAEEDRADLGASQREPQVAGLAGVDRVYRQASGLVGRLLKNAGLEGHRKISR
jgi:hypothetical protein